MQKSTDFKICHREVKIVPNGGADRVRDGLISLYTLWKQLPKCPNEFLTVPSCFRIVFYRFQLFLHRFWPFSNRSKTIPTCFKIFWICFWWFQNVLKSFAITLHRISGDFTPSKSVKYRFLMRFQSFKNDSKTSSFTQCKVPPGSRRSKIRVAHGRPNFRFGACTEISLIRNWFYSVIR